MCVLIYAHMCVRVCLHRRGLFAFLFCVLFFSFCVSCVSSRHCPAVLSLPCRFSSSWFVLSSHTSTTSAHTLRHAPPRSLPPPFPICLVRVCGRVLCDLV